MKYLFSLAALSSLLQLSLSSPAPVPAAASLDTEAPKVVARVDPPVYIDNLSFYSVDFNTSYFLTTPATGVEFFTNNPLSVSTIVLSGGGIGGCVINGIDGLKQNIFSGVNTVGPPQTIVSGQCFN